MSAEYTLPDPTTPFRSNDELAAAMSERDGNGTVRYSSDEAFRKAVETKCGHRVYQPVGFKVAADQRTDEDAAIGTNGDAVSAKRLGERIHWEWMQELHDWIDLTSGETLSGCEPQKRWPTSARG
jgi:hypothetical protein